MEQISNSVTWLINEGIKIAEKIGSVAIVTAITSFIAFRINARFEKRLSLKYDKKLEILRGQIDQLAFTHQTQYGMEFETYKDLCSSFHTMVQAVHWLFPSGLDRIPSERDKLSEICQQRLRGAQEAFNTTVAVTGSKAPFIDKSMYERFQELTKLAAQQLNAYLLANPVNDDGSNPSITEISIDGYKRTDEIIAKWNTLLEELRDYLQKQKNRRTEQTRDSQ